MNTRYNAILFGAAVFVWLLALSGVYAQSAWLSILDWLCSHGWSTDARRAFLGSMVLLGIVASVLGAFAHICICIVPALRTRYRPRLLSHFAFLALLWLAYGGVTIALSRPFPYLAR
jgi:hypothetical protein